jgi:hypothetical protein
MSIWASHTSPVLVSSSAFFFFCRQHSILSTWDSSTHSPAPHRADWPRSLYTALAPVWWAALLIGFVSSFDLTTLVRFLWAPLFWQDRCGRRRLLLVFRVSSAASATHEQEHKSSTYWYNQCKNCMQNKYWFNLVYCTSDFDSKPIVHYPIILCL